MSATEPQAEVDPHAVTQAVRATAILAEFNNAGVLNAADVNIARRVSEIAGEDDELVTLAAAFAARAPRLGHVCTDLSRLPETVAVDADEPIDVAALSWPDPDAWITAVARSELVADGDDAGPDRPLRLVGTRLYLDRFHRDERRVAADLASRSVPVPEHVDLDRLPEPLARLFPESLADPLQRAAAATVVLRRLAVISGGPGTGKTTTVARALALLLEQVATDEPDPLVGLAAPTGKAAARLKEALDAEAERLPVSAEVRKRLAAIQASTLHRLLGSQPWRPGRFKYNRGNQLPHDLVVVDETSMVSLPLMARLLEAVRPDARLVLVGDAEQLASVEAGAVLGDVVGPATAGLRLTEKTKRQLELAAAAPLEAEPPPEGSAIADSIIVLRRVHRFRGGIAALAEAVRLGDEEAALAVLLAGHEDVVWLEGSDDEASLAPIQEAVVDAGIAVHAAASTGDGRAALDALGRFRLLCAHRRGEHGVAMWTPRIEEWLAKQIDGYGAGRWYVGQPLMVTENDYSIRLFNGDTGVVVAGEDHAPRATFDRGSEVALLSPSRLEAVETVHAMTIHKAQGSQFATVAIVLPEPDSRILTRELLYTGLTRARKRLVVCGGEDAISAAVTRPIARASGLRGRLWT